MFPCTQRLWHAGDKEVGHRHPARCQADLTSVLAGRIPCMAVDGAHSRQLGTAMLNNAADLMDEIRAFVRDKLSEKDGPWDKLAQDAKAVPANTRPGSSKLCTEVRAHSRSMTS